MKNSNKLSAAYFDKFILRVKVLRVFYDEGGYSDVFREGQEALELFIKALLRSIQIEPSFGHDPGKELAVYQENLDAPWKDQAKDLVYWSRELRKNRELSFYGAEDFIPTEEYTKKDAEEVLVFLERIAKILKNWRKQGL